MFQPTILKLVLGVGYEYRELNEIVMVLGFVGGMRTERQMEDLYCAFSAPINPSRAVGSVALSWKASTVSVDDPTRSEEGVLRREKVPRILDVVAEPGSTYWLFLSGKFLDTRA